MQPIRMEIQIVSRFFKQLVKLWEARRPTSEDSGVPPLKRSCSRQPTTPPAEAKWKERSADQESMDMRTHGIQGDFEMVLRAAAEHALPEVYMRSQVSGVRDNFQILVT